MQEFDKKYWNKLFNDNRIGWDIGYVSPSIAEYFNQVENKEAKILVPGAGNAYEVEFLYENGFKNIFMLDFSEEAVKSFKKRYSKLPDNQIITQNFFEFEGKFDYIIEQTFFTSFHPSKRTIFAEKIHSLLSENGKYIGLFFNHEFGKNYPPFGALIETYKQLFDKYFHFKTFETAYNSIKPRKNRELFFIFEKIEYKTLR